jgi:hypothetical protein
MVNSIAVPQVTKKIQSINSTPRAGETQPSLEEITNRIYRLESSGGKNDSCKKYGKVNGFGYSCWTNHLTCFDSHDIVRKKVSDWFEEKLKKYSLSESLCLYNRGIVTSDCDYQNNFFNL